MPNITIELPAETKERFVEKASREGKSVELYARAILEADAQSPNNPLAPARIEPQEFKRLLAALSAGLPPLPPLPADFGRADLYDDHD
jgi:hypothetical protein